MGTDRTEPNQVSHMSPFKLRLLMKTSATNGSFQKSCLTLCRTVQKSRHFLKQRSAGFGTYWRASSKRHAGVASGFFPHLQTDSHINAVGEFQEEESLYSTNTIVFVPLCSWGYSQPFVPTSPAMTWTPETFHKPPGKKIPQHPGRAAVKAVCPSTYVHTQTISSSFSGVHRQPDHHLLD